MGSNLDCGGAGKDRRTTGETISQGERKGDEPVIFFIQERAKEDDFAYK